MAEAAGVTPEEYAEYAEGTTIFDAAPGPRLVRGPPGRPDLAARDGPADQPVPGVVGPDGAGGRPRPASSSPTSPPPTSRTAGDHGAARSRADHPVRCRHGGGADRRTGRARRGPPERRWSRAEARRRGRVGVASTRSGASAPRSRCAGGWRSERSACSPSSVRGCSPRRSSTTPARSSSRRRGRPGTRSSRCGATARCGTTCWRRCSGSASATRSRSPSGSCSAS